MAPFTRQFIHSNIHYSIPIIIIIIIIIKRRIVVNFFTTGTIKTINIVLCFDLLFIKWCAFRLFAYANERPAFYRLFRSKFDAFVLVSLSSVRLFFFFFFFCFFFFFFFFWGFEFDYVPLAQQKCQALRWLFNCWMTVSSEMISRWC